MYIIISLPWTSQCERIQIIMERWSSSLFGWRNGSFLSRLIDIKSDWIYEFIEFQLLQKYFEIPHEKSSKKFKDFHHKLHSTLPGWSWKSDKNKSVKNQNRMRKATIKLKKAHCSILNWQGQHQAEKLMRLTLYIILNFVLRLSFVYFFRNSLWMHNYSIW